VIDCGSNSTRALLVDLSNTTLAREMQITRLSQGVDATGSLLPEAMDRTFHVLERYRALCDGAGVTKGLLVATSAVRDASNGDVFLGRAREIMGFEARVLRGDEEAAYSYAGATADLASVNESTMIVDVGGGSTELAFERGETLISYSMQLGCVRVTERALGKGVVTPSSDAAARAMIDEELDRAFSSTPALAEIVAKVRLVGLAGTVATLASLDAGLATYDRDVVHHRMISRAALGHWCDLLGAESPEARLRHPGMIQGREDVLVAGLYILDAVMERFQVDEFLSSENDILDGITAALLRS
jgi:exopolyphosphatase/guanosine-5'-triphosphate,3'-diphosphate pyrophosphatase